MNTKKWELLYSTKKSKIKKPKNDDIIGILLENRGLKTQTEKQSFLNPKKPEELDIKELGIDPKSVDKAVGRIREAVDKSEEIVIYGDYDADGICATAILWETLYSLTKKVMPYIPDRFSEGYGITAQGVENVIAKYPEVKVLITVDNGIVAHEGIKRAKELKIDVIVTDHHQKDNNFLDAYAVVHTDKISGSGVSWIFSREISKSLKTKFPTLTSGLELAAIGTVSDQLPLIGPNRSIVKHGLKSLTITKRPGLLALFEMAAINGSGNKELGTYEVNFQIAPRINAMGRLKHGLDSLRLLCTKNLGSAKELALHLNGTNIERQKIVDEVLAQSLLSVKDKKDFYSIVISDPAYHEGVIGLAAGKLAEKYYRPSIVISKGEKESKASARSIPGFNIIETIRKLKHLIITGGGHPMAAGFSIKTENIDKFSSEFEKLSKSLLTEELLLKKLKIDIELDFENIGYELIKDLKQFDPTGIGNPTPLFLTRRVTVIQSTPVGSEGKHLKLKLVKDNKTFEAIAFNFSAYNLQIITNNYYDIVYSIDENVWNGNTSIQLRIKDIKS
jgi:single-stranded-DNA-specific exonuclease